jgi:diglucosylglycerate octanoyltransferase
MATEDKWKANFEKVAFMKQFPGLLGTWEALKGKTIEAVIPLKGKQGAAAIICSDGTFTVAPPMMTEPYELGETLAVGRSILEPKHQKDYVEYDRLAKKDKDALKTARLEKIIGAIENNLEQIPELKERLKALVKEWK